MAIDKQKLAYSIGINKQRAYFKQVYKVNDITKKLVDMEKGPERTRLEKHLKINISKRDRAADALQSTQSPRRISAPRR